MYWTLQAEHAAKQGEVMAKEKALLPQLACYFKEDTECLVHMVEVCPKSIQLFLGVKNARNQCSLLITLE